MGRQAPYAPMGRRAFLRAMGMTGAGLALAGCGAAGRTPDIRPPINLVYQDWRTEWFPPMAQQMLEQFHTTHSDIRVFYVPDPEDFEEEVLSDMQAGSAPDLFQACCAFFPVLDQMGYAMDLRELVARDLDATTIKDWDPAQYRSLFGRQGRQFGLPKYHGALGVYYNRDLFDEYHVAYPGTGWDHEDYLSAMRRLTKDRNSDGKTDLWGSMFDISWDRIQMHINGWGGNFVDPDDPSICQMGEEPAMAALEWLRARMWDENVMATPQDVQGLSTREAFIRGQVAMVEDGSWALKDILAGADFRVGIAPFPAGPVRQVTLATTDGFGIYAKTQHEDAAWELMQFLISPAYGRAMAKANFLQPARLSLVEEWQNFVRQEFPEATKDLDLTIFADGHLKGYSVTTEVFANMVEAQSIAAAAWEEILALGQTPTERIRDAAAAIQAAQGQKESGRACGPAPCGRDAS